MIVGSHPNCESFPLITLRTAVFALLTIVLLQAHAIAGGGDTGWMLKAKYGIFVHYQYRILLGYSVATKPQFPQPSQMTAGEWNRFVDGFDVHGFADQVAEARAGWVIFCIDDHYFAWPCAPEQGVRQVHWIRSGAKSARAET